MVEPGVTIKHPRVIVLPGMGASSDMYGPVWKALPGAEFLNWPKEYVPTGILDLAQYLAQYLAKDLPSNSLCVVGSSLGGMVALELADILGAESVVLVGSARSGHEVNALLRLLTPLAKITPMKLCQALAGKSSHGLTEMFAEQNPEFIRAMIQAIPKWEYTGKIKSFRIHGRKDHVITCTDADLTLNGGHLLGMTHAEDCVEFIKENIQRP